MQPFAAGELFEATGSPIITDGEQAKLRFATRSASSSHLLAPSRPAYSPDTSDHRP